MKTRRSVWSLAAVAALGLSAFAGGPVAYARDLTWSVGVASPGVQVGVSNAPPLIYQRPAVVLPAPVYYGNPQPVYYGQPQPIYYGQPQVVYIQAAPYMQSGWMAPGYRYGWGPHGRWHHGGRDRDDDRRGFDQGGGGRH